jgi:hypothetical protein
MEYWSDDDVMPNSTNDSPTNSKLSNTQLEDLPVELILKILSCLDLPHQLKLAHVSKALEGLVFDGKVFKNDLEVTRLSTQLNMNAFKQHHVNILFNHMKGRLSAHALTTVKLDLMPISIDSVKIVISTVPNLNILGLTGCSSLVWNNQEDLYSLMKRFEHGKAGIVGTIMPFKAPRPFLLSVTRELLDYAYKSDCWLDERCSKCDTVITAYPTIRSSLSLAALNSCPECHVIAHVCPGPGLLKRYPATPLDILRELRSEVKEDDHLIRIMTMEIDRLIAAEQTLFETPNCSLRCSSCGTRGSACFSCSNTTRKDLSDYGGWCWNSICGNWTCFERCRETFQDYCGDCTAINEAYGVNDPLEMLQYDADFGMA